MHTHGELLREFNRLIVSASDPDSLMQRMAHRMHEALSRYNWVGFYLTDKNDPGVLIVGPHTGSFTPHTRIPLDRGLCGAAVTTRKTIVVNDVSKDRRYIAGSDMVKSEIVAPVFAGEKLLCELDVNSYFVGTFTQEEQKFVEACASLVGKYFERSGDVK